MAKATQSTHNDAATIEPNPSVALAEQPAAGGAMVTTNETPDFAADAGRGMEGAGVDSFAIPFLVVLQKGSPQVDEALGQVVEGARAGMLYENVTGRLYDGKKGVTLVPCHYRRVFLRWGPKGSAGSGFKGELLPEQVAQMRTDKRIVEMDNRLYVPAPDGSVNEKTCDRISDVRNHYVLLLDDETGAWTQALVSLGSTQIKKSKTLMSALLSLKWQGPSGMYQPPTFANTTRMTTMPESNDKGSWFGVRFETPFGVVKRTDVYAAAKAFHESVKKGTVEVKYDENAAAGEDMAGAAPARDDNRF